MTNCISNIIGRQNLSDSDIAALNLFKKENEVKKGRYVEAPNSLYRYSPHQELLNEDEFRKSVKAEMAAEKTKKKSHSKALFVAAAAALTVPAYKLLKRKA